MSATPTIPAPDLGAFAGTVLHDGFLVDSGLVTARRVALIGDPRRVVRAVPDLARRASVLKVFQRDGVWVLPAYGPFGSMVDAVAGLVPSGPRWRIAAAVAACDLRHHVRDGWTRRHLEPQVDAGATTMVRSDGYYRSLRRSNVELIGWPIANVVASGIRTADGLEHRVDVIVVA